MRCAPVFQSQIDSLINHKTVDFTLEHFESGSQPEKSGGYDRFVLVQNFCGKQIRWTIILDQHNPRIAPDFIFEQDDFVGAQIPLLEMWDPSMSQSLLNVILALRKLLKDQHKQFVQNCSDARVRFEYSTVQDLQGAEFFTYQKEVIMALPLNDLLLDPAAGENESKPILFIKFYPDTSKPTEATWTLPPNWARIIVKMELPKWSLETRLLEYLVSVKEMIKKLVVNFQVKRQVVEELIKAMGSPTEVDTKTYSSLAFLYDVSQYSIIVTVGIRNKFPQEPPQIVFQSFTQFVRNRPFIKEWPNCPWSPRWTPQDMAKRLRYVVQFNLL